MILKYEPTSEPLHISVKKLFSDLVWRTAGSGVPRHGQHLLPQRPWREAGPPNHVDDKVVSDQ